MQPIRADVIVNPIFRNSLNTEVTITREGSFIRTEVDVVEEINIFEGILATHSQVTCIW